MPANHETRLFSVHQVRKWGSDKLVMEHMFRTRKRANEWRNEPKQANSKTFYYLPPVKAKWGPE